VQVPEVPGAIAGWPTTAGAGSGTPEAAFGDGLGLTDISQDVLGIAVPRFADGAAVFVLERQLAGGAGPCGPDTGGPDAQGVRQTIARRLGTRFGGSSGPVPGDAFPAGEVVALAAGSPYAACVQTMRPVAFTRPDATTLERARPAARGLLTGHSSFLALPMTARGVAVGLLVVSRGPGRPAFNEAETGLLAGIAARTGNWIVHASLLAEHQRIARSLQLGLQPTEPASPAGIEVACRCLPAAGHIVGGDWCDIIGLPGRRTGLLVGDAMGHGPAAAAAMAQLRAAAHALAGLDLAPAELLRQLDRTASTLTGGTYATCAYCVIDPRTQSGTVALAGHLPPVIALPDGGTQVPALPAGLSLGLGTAIFGQARVQLPPGSVLALFTDGLVESRTRPFDEGVLVLRSALGSRHSSLESAAEAIVATLTPQREDDVTVLLARMPAAGGPGASEPVPL
jgi:GAF domain-containing protein